MESSKTQTTNSTVGTAGKPMEWENLPTGQQADRQDPSNPDYEPKEQKTMETNNKQTTATTNKQGVYALVENAGAYNETMVRDGLTFKEAMREIKRRYCEDEIESGFVKIMREQEDGTYTTEY